MRVRKHRLRTKNLLKKKCHLILLKNEKGKLASSSIMCSASLVQFYISSETTIIHDLQIMHPQLEFLYTCTFN